MTFILKDIRDGKTHGAIPTAIGKTPVIRVMPTKESSTQIQPKLNAIGQVSQSAEQALAQANGGSKPGTASRSVGKSGVGGSA